MTLAGFRSSNHPQQVAKRGATDRDNLGTDPELFAKLDERFHFTLDVAASSKNAKCNDFYDEWMNGLGLAWTGRVWCNPPYSQIRDWVEKAWAEWETGDCELIAMLLPANRPEQAWWQDLVEPYRDRGNDLTTEFIRGRQRFVMPGAEAIGPNERPPFGCVLLIWQLPIDAAPTGEIADGSTDRYWPEGGGTGGR